MTQTLDEGTRTARKAHRCFHCCRDIVPGTLYGYQTNKYDYVYTLAWHLDCQELDSAYRDVCGHWDWMEEGLPGLREDWCGSGEYYTNIKAWRGEYPHVICRLELTDQLNGWEK